jgi:hypothetical protein
MHKHVTHNRCHATFADFSGVIETTQALCAHVLAFVAAYNFAKHLKALRWRTPFHATRGAWKTDAASSKINPHRLTMGL